MITLITQLLIPIENNHQYKKKHYIDIASTKHSNKIHKKLAQTEDRKKLNLKQDCTFIFEFPYMLNDFRIWLDNRLWWTTLTDHFTISIYMWTLDSEMLLAKSVEKKNTKKKKRKNYGH